MAPRGAKAGSSGSILGMVVFAMGLFMMLGSLLIASSNSSERARAARESLINKLHVQEETLRVARAEDLLKATQADPQPIAQPCPACPVQAVQQEAAPQAPEKPVSAQNAPQALVRISKAKKEWKSLKEVGLRFPKDIIVGAPIGPTMDIEGTGLAPPMADKAPSGKQTVCIAAVLKGESHTLREWLYHYIKEGVTHFYMINNDELYSDEFWRFCEVVAPFIDAGWVTASHYTMPANITAGYDSRINLQVHAITAIALRKSQEEYRHEWMLTVDLDEFMYGVGTETIASVLESRHPNVTQVCVPWITFTSSGFDFQPPCIAPYFTERLVTPEKGRDTSGKCAVRVRSAWQLQNHMHQEYAPNSKPMLVVTHINGSGDAWDKTFIVTSRARSLAPLPRFFVDESNVPAWPIRLNHYMRQSWVYFHHKRSKNTALSTFEYDKQSANALQNLFYAAPDKTVRDHTLAKKMHWVGLGCVPKKWDERQLVDILPGEPAPPPPALPKPEPPASLQRPPETPHKLDPDLM